MEIHLIKLSCRNVGARFRSRAAAEAAAREEERMAKKINPMRHTNQTVRTPEPPRRTQSGKWRMVGIFTRYSLKCSRQPARMWQRQLPPSSSLLFG